MKDCANCNEINQLSMDYYINLHSQNEKYTSLVLTVGYASMILIILALSKSLIQYSRQSFLLSIIFLILSIGIFITFEILKIKCNHNYEKSIANEFLQVMDKHIHLMF